jgi:hypothetical protein
MSMVNAGSNKMWFLTAYSAIWTDYDSFVLTATQDLHKTDQVISLLFLSLLHICVIPEAFIETLVPFRPQVI